MTTCGKQVAKNSSVNNMVRVTVIYRGKTHAVELEATETIGDLKRSIAHLGVPAQDAELIHKGKKLSNDALLLQDIVVKDQAKLMLMKRPRTSSRFTLRCLASGRMVRDVTCASEESIEAMGAAISSIVVGSPAGAESEGSTASTATTAVRGQAAILLNNVANSAKSIPEGLSKDTASKVFDTIGSSPFGISDKKNGFATPVFLTIPPTPQNE